MIEPFVIRDRYREIVVDPRGCADHWEQSIILDADRESEAERVDVLRGGDRICVIGEAQPVERASGGIRRIIRPFTPRFRFLGTYGTSQPGKVSPYMPAPVFLVAKNGRLVDKTHLARGAWKHFVQAAVWAAASIYLLDVGTPTLLGELRRFELQRVLSGTDRKEQVESLRGAMADPAHRVRLLAASELAKRPEYGRLMISDLSAATRDANWEVQAMAADALGAIGPAASSSVANLLRMATALRLSLWDTDPWPEKPRIELKAEHAIGRIGHAAMIETLDSVSGREKEMLFSMLAGVRDLSVSALDLGFRPRDGDPAHLRSGLGRISPLDT